METQMQTGLTSDTTVHILEEDVKQSAGFSVDIGTSVGKLMYRSKKEYKDGVRLDDQGDDKKGVVHYALFPRNDIDGIVQYLRDNADIKRNKDGFAEVFCSGVGGSAFKKRIEEGLSVKVTVLNEMECFVKSFITLTKTCSYEELVYPPSEKALVAAEKLKSSLAKYMKLLQEKDVSVKMGASGVKEEVVEGDNPHLPCLLMVCGSGTGLLKIEKDETYSIFQGPLICGRFFYGLASYLAGTNNFKKIMDMASKGDGCTTDIFSSDLMAKEGEDAGEVNMYNIMGDMDILIFPMGKVAEAEGSSIKKEDLVYSLYNAVASVHAQFALMLMEAHNLKRSYFSGNLFNNEFGRDLIIERKGMHDAFIPPDTVCTFEFIRNGGMLGVLGAFLSKKEKTEESAN